VAEDFLETARPRKKAKSAEIRCQVPKRKYQVLVSEETLIPNWREDGGVNFPAENLKHKGKKIRRTIQN